MSARSLGATVLFNRVLAILSLSTYTYSSQPVYYYFAPAILTKLCVTLYVMTCNVTFPCYLQKINEKKMERKNKNNLERQFMTLDMIDDLPIELPYAHRIYHKLHLAISPLILQQFSQSQWL